MKTNLVEFFNKIERDNFENGVPDEYLKIPKQTVDLLKEKDLKITAAESLTAGMFQSEIANVPGASNIFDGGFVTYADDVKVHLLGMEQELIDRYTVVSAPVAKSMASLSAQKLDANIGVGFTGVAGPDSLEGNPVGTVFISACNNKKNQNIVNEFHFSGSRQAIRKKSVLCGFALVQEII